MSDERPTHQRQFTARSACEREEAHRIPSNAPAPPAFGRQGPEVRILSPRPIIAPIAAKCLKSVAYRWRRRTFSADGRKREVERRPNSISVSEKG